MTPELRVVINRLKSIENKQDLFDKERDILEDILLKLGNIDERLKLVEDNANRKMKDLKAEIGNVGEQVVGSLDDLTTEIDNTPTKKMNFLGKIKLILKRK